MLLVIYPLATSAAARSYLNWLALIIRFVYFPTTYLRLSTQEHVEINEIMWEGRWLKKFVTGLLIARENCCRHPLYIFRKLSTSTKSLAGEHMRIRRGRCPRKGEKRREGLTKPHPRQRENIHELRLPCKCEQGHLVSNDITSSQVKLIFS
jgi:hypothetical protein